MKRVEVVSDGTKEKDHGDGPERYAAAGVRELWTFDPRLCGGGTRGGPFLLEEESDAARRSSISGHQPSAR